MTTTEFLTPRGHRFSRQGIEARKAPSSAHPLALAAFQACLACLACYGAPASAQSKSAGAETSPLPLGISTQGVTGGLVIPSAHVLPQGSVAFTYGNYQESQLGAAGTQQNLSLGFGLLPGFEFFGRFANYVDPIPGSILSSGQRDLSVNIKLQVPTPWASGPKIALGVNDIAGGAAFFKSIYAVASQQFGAVTGTVGYAQGSSAFDDPAQPATFNGLFGGAAWRVGDTGLSVLAEYDGRQRHAGVRWQSPPIAALARAQIVGTVQQSFGAVAPNGANADATKYAVSVVVPLGDNEIRRAQFKPDTSAQLPPLDAKPVPGTLQPTPEDRLASLRKSLSEVGLERVRVGLRDGMLGQVVVVEYENNRYGHNEADALGLVLGLGAELAPKGVQRVHAITLKAGLPLYETSVGVTAYREFLRDGSPSPVRDSMIWDRVGMAEPYPTRWLDDAPTPYSRVRIGIKPEIAYTLGTEISPLDYSLAANLQFKVPLWRGARLQSSYVQQFANSPNMAIGAVFEELRQRNGLKSLALQQSFWLAPGILTNLSVGRFQYDVYGVQGEAMAFIPGTDNLLHARGAVYNQAPGGLAGDDRAFAASYRHALASSMFVEAGVQKYGDGSMGPTLEWTRWFGDVAVQLFYRRGGDRQFAGLQLSLPLLGRQGMAPGPVTFSGSSLFSQSVRTRITTASQPQNLVQPSAVRDIALESSMDMEQLNAGRVSQSYFVGQIHRMREVFYIYGLSKL